MSEASEVSKPFECTSPGCKATFTNEDHLSSHQKRHEMSLLLPGGITISRSNSLTLGADLTPTPTRFIRIGEEVGLFQDLLKANPFDEQFRKAAEQNKAASVTLPLPFSGSCDETLNTPHIVHPGEDGQPGKAAPPGDTPQARLASPPSLGSPPPAHVVITPCSPLLKGRGGAPPAHRDPADPDPGLGIDDDMEVEGPLDMRSPSVIPPVSEPLISPPVIPTTVSLSSPPVIHGSGPLGSPHGSVLPPATRSASLGSPPPCHTPTTLQSSAVSSTVATPRHQLGVPPPQLRPRPQHAATLPPALSGPHSIVQTRPHPGSHPGTHLGPHAGIHTAAHPGVHSGAHAGTPSGMHPSAVPGAHPVSLPGAHSGSLPIAHTGLQSSLPAAHQASQPPSLLPAHQSSHPLPSQIPDPASMPSEGVEFQMKLDGHVVPMALHAEAGRMPGRMVTPPGGNVAVVTAANELAAAAAAKGASGTVRERLKRSLQRLEQDVPPLSVPPPAVSVPPADRQSPTQRRASQSEDSLRKERNRAAANRWRARKKRAQQQMATTMEALTCSVNDLRHENAELRAQLGKLRLFLVQHRDCDVTRGIKPPADTEGSCRVELEELSRLMGAEPAVSAGGGLVSPAEDTRRVARPAGPGPPVVYSSGPSPAGPSGGPPRLILLQPAPGGPRLPQPQQQPQPQQPGVRHYRLPAAALPPPAAHGR